MKKFIDSDILGSIKANLEIGNITLDDYNQLLELLNKLYHQIMLQYQRKGGDKEMKPFAWLTFLCEDSPEMIELLLRHSLRMQG